MIENIYNLSKKKEIMVLGLMTGTSADGLDLTCVHFKGDGKYPDYEVCFSDFIPYPKEFSDVFKKPMEMSAHQIAEYHVKLA